jgi:hypothetical protein
MCACTKYICIFRSSCRELCMVMSIYIHMDTQYVEILFIYIYIMYVYVLQKIKWLYTKKYINISFDGWELSNWVRSEMRYCEICPAGQPAATHGARGALVYQAIDCGRTIKYVYPIGAVSKMSDVDWPWIPVLTYSYSRWTEQWNPIWPNWPIPWMNPLGSSTFFWTRTIVVITPYPVVPISTIPNITRAKWSTKGFFGLMSSCHSGRWFRVNFSISLTW